MGYLVIADVKRGDIGSTAEAYAKAHLDVAGADALTVNPYLGTDGLEPFFVRCREAGKGVFVLVKTSNPSSADIQDLLLASGEPVYRRVAGLVNQWGAGTEGRHGYRAVGAVVGATHPREGAELRAVMAGVPLLFRDTARRELRRTISRASSTTRGAARWSIRRGRSSMPTANVKSMSWQDAASAEASEMKAALWKAAGR